MHYGRELMQYSMVHDILNILTNRVCLENFIVMPRIYLQSHNSKLPLSHQGKKLAIQNIKCCSKNDVFQDKRFERCKANMPNIFYYTICVLALNDYCSTFVRE